MFTRETFIGKDNRLFRFSLSKTIPSCLVNKDILTTYNYDYDDIDSTYMSYDKKEDFFQTTYPLFAISAYIISISDDYVFWHRRTFYYTEYLDIELIRARPEGNDLHFIPEELTNIDSNSFLSGYLPKDKYIKNFGGLFKKQINISNLEDDLIQQSTLTKNYTFYNLSTLFMSYLDLSTFAQAGKEAFFKDYQFPLQLELDPYIEELSMVKQKVHEELAEDFFIEKTRQIDNLLKRSKDKFRIKNIDNNRFISVLLSGSDLIFPFNLVVWAILDANQNIADMGVIREKYFQPKIKYLKRHEKQVARFSIKNFSIYNVYEEEQHVFKSLFRSTLLNLFKQQIFDL